MLTLKIEIFEKEKFLSSLLFRVGHQENEYHESVDLSEGLRVTGLCSVVLTFANLLM
jgi:hypothetical protein